MYVCSTIGYDPWWRGRRFPNKKRFSDPKKGIMIIRKVLLACLHRLQQSLVSQLWTFNFYYNERWWVLRTFDRKSYYMKWWLCLCPSNPKTHSLGLFCLDSCFGFASFSLLKAKQGSILTLYQFLSFLV